VRLPAPGRLLVDSAQGPWVVQQDGSKRLIGAYEAASWSPRGLFVVATRDKRLVALEPDGDVRWTVTRPGRVADARWARSGFRIAYREGPTLRVVVGDGTGDRLFARGVALVAPAWHPDESRNVLAYAEAGGRIRVADVDTGDELWSAPSTGSIAQLVWSADGSRLLVVSANGTARLHDDRGREVGGYEQVTRAAFSPLGDTLAYATYDPATDRSTVRLIEDGRSRTLFPGTGRFEDVVWSPDGRWLLVTWPEVDQWLFLRAPSVRGPVSVPNIAREFDPGGGGASAFPRVAGWAPAPAG
jgi:WD40 repeat protein